MRLTTYICLDRHTGSERRPAAARRRAMAALFTLALCPGLSGCILGSERPELNLEVPAGYREASPRAPDAALPAMDWWKGFRSSELTSLMQEAQIQNLTIAAAVAQMIQADALVPGQREPNRRIRAPPRLGIVLGSSLSERCDGPR